MPRLIDFKRGYNAPATTVRVGDVLSFGATGGRVRWGADVIRMLGAFLPATAADQGQMVAPVGPPSVVLFLAMAPGAAMLDLISGDPWSVPHTTSIEVNVDP